MILDAVHETAIDLHKLGFIDKRTMESYNALCVPSVPLRVMNAAGKTGVKEPVIIFIPKERMLL